MISGGLNIREKLQTVAMSLKWALLYYPMIDSIHFGNDVETSRLPACKGMEFGD